MELPLQFSFQQVVYGSGYVAGAIMHGRALLDDREGGAGCPTEHWISGVAPVGISGGGEDLSVALREFRNSWVTVLFDIAAEAKGYDEFKAACLSFFEARAPSMTKAWDAALDEARRANRTIPGLPSKPPVQVAFNVVEIKLETSVPSENTLEDGVLAAA